MINLRNAVHLAAAGLCALGLAGGAMAQDRPEGVFGNKRGSGELWCVPVPTNASDAWMRSMMWDQMTFGTSGPCDPRLEYLDRGTWGRTVLVSGADASGLTATFRLYILDETYAWALGSASRIEEEGRPADFAPLLSTAQFLDQVCNSTAVIGVGAASFEGDVPSNTLLAEARANVISEQVQGVAANCPADKPAQYALNLGPNRNKVTGSSAFQRRVLIATVESEQAGVNLSEALADGLNTPDIMGGFNLEDYAVFDLTRR